MSNKSQYFGGKRDILSTCCWTFLIQKLDWPAPLFLSWLVNGVQAGLLFRQSCLHAPCATGALPYVLQDHQSSLEARAIWRGGPGSDGHWSSYQGWWLPCMTGMHVSCCCPSCSQYCSAVSKKCCLLAVKKAASCSLLVVPDADQPWLLTRTLPLLWCVQAVVATNKFEKDMAMRFGGGSGDVSGLFFMPDS